MGDIAGGGERVSLLLRLRRGTVVRLDEVARELDTSRSQAIRELLALGFTAREGRGASRPAPVLQSDIASSADAEELGWWRRFGERTAINGDPARTVEVGADLAGWTFMVVPERDEHLEIA